MFKRITKKQNLKSDRAIWNKGFGLFLIAIGIASLFLMFRLRKVELDYEIASISKKIELAKSENRDLHARKARSISTENLKKMATKLGFVGPKSDRIIVIP